MERTTSSFFSRWRAELFREPGQRGRYWLFAPGHRYFTLQLLTAGLLLFYGFFAARSTPNLVALALGVWGVLGAAAELLPKNHTRLAGFLRLCSTVAFLLALVVIVSFTLHS